RGTAGARAPDPPPGRLPGTRVLRAWPRLLRPRSPSSVRSGSLRIHRGRIPCRAVLTVVDARVCAAESAPSLERPPHVLANDRRRMLRARRERRVELRIRGRIAERDRDVPEPAFVARASDRAALGACGPLRLRPAEQVDEARGVEPMTRRKIRQ